MSYQALARKWRPKTFDQVIGQDHVVAALTNALNTERVHHAFLFTGTRGVGKTTLARIFAKALNCEVGVDAVPCEQCTACLGVDQGNFIDLIEVDAASRTKVDDTRELLDNVQYTPTQGRYKIYLIDEVHMLSTHSFNALLKTLEEPPGHVKFLLATTDPQKLPTTILSRCIQFNLKSMDMERLTTQLEKILDAESIRYELPALTILARSGNGSVRDALSLLDQAIAFGNGEVATDQVRQMLGMIDEHYIHDLLTHLGQSNAPSLLEVVAQMAERSVDFSTAMDDLLMMIHHVSLFQVSPEAVEWKGLDNEVTSSLAGDIAPELLQLFYQIGLMGKKDLPLAPDPRVGFEMALLRMVAFQPNQPAPQGAVDATPKPSTPRSAHAGVSHDQTSVGEDRSSNRGNVESSEMREVRGPDKAQDDMDQYLADRFGDRLNDLDSHPAAGSNFAESEMSAKPEGPAKVDMERYDTLVHGRKITIEQLGDIDGWNEFIDASGLKGMAREMIMNMVPKSVVGKNVTLSLSSEQKYLFNANRLKKIEQHCQQKQHLNIKFTIEVEEPTTIGEETPSARREREKSERVVAARRAFVQDPNVQEMVDLFDADIVTESIKSTGT